MTGAIVITSIYGLTDAVKASLQEDGWDVIFVADQKTPTLGEGEERAWIDREDFVYLDCERQKDLGWGTTRVGEWNRYQRKNIGYLYAIRNDYDQIVDMDDDNAVHDDWQAAWPSPTDQALKVAEGRFPNPYEHFSDPFHEFVWPRGMPLDELAENRPAFTETMVTADDIAVVQGMVNGDPDVDAIYRLVFGKDDWTFTDREPLILSEGSWVPFNAQNTLYRDPETFPYLYLPWTTTMRVTDILRSYVMQRGLWAHDKRVTFSRANVHQDRNPHDLMVDFEDELANYLDVKEWVEVLESCDLSGPANSNVWTMYEDLVDAGLLDEKELVYLDAWLTDQGL